MDAIEAIKARRSVRRYLNEGIPKEDLLTILDCGRLAPSGCNEQPYIFVVVDDTLKLSAMAELCRHGRFLAEAGCAVAVFIQPEYITPFEDACAATENMMIAAAALGYGTCWVNSHRLEHSADIERLLNCPPSYELATLFSLGHPAYTPRPIEKKPLEVLVRYNGF